MSEKQRLAVRISIIGLLIVIAWLFICPFLGSHHDDYEEEIKRLNEANEALKVKADALQQSKDLLLDQLNRRVKDDRVKVYRKVSSATLDDLYNSALADIDEYHRVISQGGKDLQGMASAGRGDLEEYGSGENKSILVRHP